MFKKGCAFLCVFLTFAITCFAEYSVMTYGADYSGKEIQAQESKDGTYMYALNENQEAIILGIKKGESTLTISNQVDGYPVFSVGDRALYQSPSFVMDEKVNDTVQRIVIEEGIKCLGYSFISCYNLKSLSLPQSLEELWTGAFNISNLKGFKYPPHLKLLGRLTYPKSQSDITLPESLETLLDEAFRGAHFSYIKVPKNVQYLGKQLFKEGKMKSVRLEEGISYVSEEMCMECTNLTKATLPKSMTLIEKNAFNGCVRLINIYLSDLITKIEQNAFTDCKALEKVTLPENLETLEKEAFMGCERLEKVKFNCVKLATLEERIFKNCEKLKTVVLPESLTKISSEAFANCKKLSYVTIPKSVTEIAPDAFKGCPASLRLKVKKDSFAYYYAKEQGIKYAIIR